MHHFARRTAGFAALVTAAGLVLAGCGDDKKDGSASTAGALSSVSAAMNTSAMTTSPGAAMTTSARATHTDEHSSGAAEETKIAAADGEITVSGDIYKKYVASGGPAGLLGAPLEEAEDGPADGNYQDFVGGTIYAPKEGEPHIVWGAIREAWEDNGGANGKLGYPTSDEKDIPGGKQSDFTGGTITWVNGNITVTPK
ncbi:esterase [Nocardia sp. NPDC049220]|uniref:LGFP repeat-containing protein n=1 Tax=Nocardia sp. NPDC049220 TaxID=3155273 RepID=UPI003405F205